MPVPPPLSQVFRSFTTFAPASYIALLQPAITRLSKEVLLPFG